MGNWGGSLGLVVKGGDSCCNGCEFESQHCIQDGHFPPLFVVKIVMCVCKDENKWKRGRVGYFMFHHVVTCGYGFDSQSVLNVLAQEDAKSKKNKVTYLVAKTHVNLYHMYWSIKFEMFLCLLNAQCFSNMFG